jgi:hypothetical protein
MTAPRRHAGRILVILAVTALGLAVATSAYPATPASGSVGPAHPTVTWEGANVVQPVPAFSGDTCSIPSDDPNLDRFGLTVTDLGALDVSIRWSNPADDYDLYVCQGGKEINHSAGFTPLDGARESVFVPLASGSYDIRVYYSQSAGEGYRGSATWSANAGPVFDDANVPSFGPSAVVSAHFLGAEPQETMERRSPAGSRSGAIDTKRIFVDWPLSSRSNIGQVSRSLDGGNSFRLLIDSACPERSRPNCLTGGGGDTEEDVNPYNGHLYFGDQEALVQEGFASSFDHGDTFPPDKQFAVSNSTTDVDRHWIAAIDPRITSAGGLPIEGFMSYHQPGADEFVQAIDSSGHPVPQPVPQILLVSQSGQLRVDNTNGPGRGWIYQPYRSFLGHPLGASHFVVSTAYAADYQDPSAWQDNLVNGDNPTALFPWLALDNHGNAYALWATAGGVFMSVSPIDDKANNPQADPPGRPGTFWTPKVQVSLPSLGSVIFPEVIGGDAGRVGITYDGTTDHAGNGTPDQVSAKGEWQTYSAVITNALGQRGAPVIHTGAVSHRVIHRGPMCTSGTTCTGDRSLLDMIDVNYDASGRVGVVYTNNNSTFAQADPGDPRTSRSPFVYFSKQVGGPSLLKQNPTVNASPPTASRTDDPGDATWPNVKGAPNLPSLDVLHTSMYRSNDGTQVVATIQISDGRLKQMATDLAAYNARWAVDPADRLQYVMRFEVPRADPDASTVRNDDIFHMSMEFENGALRFFGGRLDQNDRLSLLPVSPSTFGAGYHTDAGVHVTGNIRARSTSGGTDYTIIMRAPAADFGIGPATKYVSAGALALAGPDEGLETTALRIMRTVDASPPFDGTI